MLYQLRETQYAGAGGMLTYINESSQWENWNHLFCYKILFSTGPCCYWSRYESTWLLLLLLKVWINLAVTVTGQGMNQPGCSCYWSRYESTWLLLLLVKVYIYIFYLELPLYHGGAYHQGRSSGASILYKTIMYNKFIAYSL
jgi:hypothetical protein